MAKVSVLELITQNIQSALSGITIENGYDYSLAVERAKVKTEPEHLKAIIHQTAKVNTDPDGNTADEKQATFTIVVYILPIDDNESYATYCNHLADAIEEALMADYTRGGYATDTLIGDVSMFPITEGEFGGFTMELTIKYRYQFGSPFVIVIE